MPPPGWNLFRRPWLNTKCGNITLLEDLLEEVETDVLFEIFKDCVIRDLYYLTAEADRRRCSVKKVFLNILQNSHENTCARVSFLIKFQASDL